MDYFGINWTAIQMNFYLWIYTLRNKMFMHMHIYIIPVQDAIMFQWSFIFESYTIRVLIFTG